MHDSSLKQAIFVHKRMRLIRVIKYTVQVFYSTTLALEQEKIYGNTFLNTIRGEEKHNWEKLIKKRILRYEMF